MVGALDLVPYLHLLGFVLGQDHVAVLVLALLEQDIDRVASLYGGFAILAAKLIDRNQPLGFVPDVHDHFVLGDLKDDALDDLTFREVAEADVVHVEKALVLLGIERRILFGFFFLGNQLRRLRRSGRL